jgi:hypothetical protein
VCDPITSHMIDTCVYCIVPGQYTFNIIFLSIFSLLSISSSFFISVLPSSLFLILFYITNLLCIELSLLASSLSFFFHFTPPPLLLFQFFGTVPISHMYFGRFYLICYFYTIVPPFRKPFRSFLSIPVFIYYVICLASYPLPSKANSPHSAS